MEASPDGAGRLHEGGVEACLGSELACAPVQVVDAAIRLDQNQAVRKALEDQRLRHSDTILPVLGRPDCGSRVFLCMNQCKESRRSGEYLDRFLRIRLPNRYQTGFRTLP